MIYRLTPLQPKKIQIVRKNVERIVSCLFFKVLFMSYDFFLNSVYTSIGIIAFAMRTTEYRQAQCGNSLFVMDVAVAFLSFHVCEQNKWLHLHNTVLEAQISDRHLKTWTNETRSYIHEYRQRQGINNVSCYFGKMTLNFFLGLSQRNLQYVPKPAAVI